MFFDYDLEVCGWVVYLDFGFFLIFRLNFVVDSVFRFVLFLIMGLKFCI